MKESPAEKEQGQSVEDVFRNGFAGAESAPPSRIWENIDRELENHELHRYKKQVNWYRSLAAAFLLLLLSGGILLWKQDFDLTGGQQNQVASQQNTPRHNAPAGVDQLGESNSHASQSRKDAAAENQNRTEESTERVAAASEASSEKQALNRSRPLFSDPQERGIASAKTNELAKEQESPKEVMPSQSLGEPKVRQETMAGISSEGKNNPVGKEKVSTQPTFPKTLPDKPFSRALANSLTPSKETAGGIDSLLSVPKRTIMAPKETEVAASAQTSPETKGNEKVNADVSRWSVAMAYTPQYAYAPVKLGNGSSMRNAASMNQAQVYQQYQEAVNEYNDSYSPTYSYSTMVGASYKINEKWQLESGVLYTQNEATTTHSYMVYGGNSTFALNSPGNVSNYNPDVNKGTPLVTSALRPEAANQPIYVARTNQYTTKYKYQQIGLPVRLAYRVNINKMYALISGGVNMNFLVQNSIAPETDQIETVTFGLSEEGSPFRTVQWATSTSIGLGYDVTENMSFLVAPEFTYSLTPMVREKRQQANTYQLGLSIGGRWRLTK